MKKIVEKVLSFISEYNCVYKISNKIIRYHKKKVSNLEKKEYEKLSHDYNDDKNIKLHFGSGPRILKGWVNIDLKFVPFEEYLESYTDEFYGENIRGNKNDFYAIDITKVGLPLPNNSVDLIFHEDFLEHLDQVEQYIFLAESLRVLKPGAIHRVNTPNLEASIKRHFDFTKGKTGVYIDEWYKPEHKNILTKKVLEEMATIVGYSKIIFNSCDNSQSKEIPREYRPGKGHPEDENIFADLIK